MTQESQSPSSVPSPKTTEVMVILTARQGVTRKQIMNIMPAEIRATVKLYLDGKIRQWYSRGDGRGVIFFLDTTTDGPRVHSRGSAPPAGQPDWRCPSPAIAEIYTQEISNEIREYF